MNAEIRVKDLKHEYDEGFVPSSEYLDSMPDLQNAPYVSLYPIERVGIHGFHMPLYVKRRDAGLAQEVVAEITGMVSLEANKAGINMSRIIRTAYGTFGTEFSVDKLCEVLKNYKKDLDTFDAHIIVKFPYRIWQEALRSVDDKGDKEGGWQYYDVCFDVTLNRNGEFRKIMYLDFVYSSACPCSTHLSEHAALTRGVYGIPHSQRSVARIAVEFEEMIWIEDLVDACRNALTTETLVFCKRQDEQAFAEKNGAQPKFVEDAIRLLSDALNNMDKVEDFKIICSHLESLHSHNAIAVTTKGLLGSKFDAQITVAELESMVK